MIEKLRQALTNPMCLSCGSYFVRHHLFCQKCYVEKIETKLQPRSHSLAQQQNAFTLFDWNPGESDLLSEMVYRFKSDRCLLAWRHYAGLAIKALSHEVDLKVIDYIIPVPGSKRSSVHGRVFADLVSEIVQKPVLDILEKIKSDSITVEQKSKNKNERVQNQFRLREEFTQNFDCLRIGHRHILLVDDIITTGSSFTQCLQVLGGAEDAVLLCLFYRSTNLKGALVS